MLSLFRLETVPPWVMPSGVYFVIPAFWAITPPLQIIAAIVQLWTTLSITFGGGLNEKEEEEKTN